MSAGALFANGAGTCRLVSVEVYELLGRFAANVFNIGLRLWLRPKARLAADCGNWAMAATVVQCRFRGGNRSFRRHQRMK
jgi:hypothetical protein